MSDILGQIGTRIGQEFNLVSDRFQGLRGSDEYSEITYDTNGNVSSVSVWEDYTKTVLIKTKTLSYTSGVLSEITVTDKSSTPVLSQDLIYDANGNLVSVFKDYAPINLGTIYTRTASSSLSLSLSVSGEKEQGSSYSVGDIVTWTDTSRNLSFTAHLETYNGSGSWVIKYDCVNYPNDCYTENNAQESDFS